MGLQHLVFRARGGNVTGQRRRTGGVVGEEWLSCGRRVGVEELWEKSGSGREQRYRDTKEMGGWGNQTAFLDPFVTSLHTSLSLLPPRFGNPPPHWAAALTESPPRGGRWRVGGRPR